jgi:hypothetical protein
MDSVSGSMSAVRFSVDLFVLLCAMNLLGIPIEKGAKRTVATNTHTWSGPSRSILIGSSSLVLDHNPFAIGNMRPA